MKKIKNEKTSMLQPNGKSYLTYCDLCYHALNSTPKGGLSVSEIHERIKVKEKLDKLKNKKEIQLEDAEFNTLKKACNRQWEFIHSDLSKFLKELGL